MGFHFDSIAGSPFVIEKREKKQEKISKNVANMCRAKIDEHFEKISIDFRLRVSKKRIWIVAFTYFVKKKIEKK